MPECADFFSGGAIYRIPVLIDGFISSVAALCAVRLAPLAGKYLFASHCSKEPGGKRVLDALGMSANDRVLTCHWEREAVRLQRFRFWKWDWMYTGK